LLVFLPLKKINISKFQFDQFDKTKLIYLFIYFVYIYGEQFTSLSTCTNDCDYQVEMYFCKHTYIGVSLGFRVSVN
jgi:hypothetical protein